MQQPVLSKFIKERSHECIRLCGCPALQKHGKTEAAAKPERTTEHAGIYASACKKVAAEAGLPVVDLWTALQVGTMSTVLQMLS